MKRQRALDTYRVSRVGSKESAQPRQADTPARDSASDSSKLLTSESMLEVEGEEADEDEEEEPDEAEWCSTWCIWERVCMAVMI